MDQLQERRPGEFAVEYGYPTAAFDSPAAEVMARVVAGLHALNSESSRRRDGSPPAARNDPGSEPSEPFGDRSGQ